MRFICLQTMRCWLALALIVVSTSGFSIADGAEQRAPVERRNSPLATDKSPFDELERDPLKQELRDRLARVSVDDFESVRKKSLAELSALHDELLKSASQDDFANLDRIVQRYRDKPTALLWGMSALCQVYGDLQSMPSDLSVDDRESWLMKWAAAQAQSSTPWMLLAQLYVDLAWQARGSAVASKVTAEQWELFSARLAKAELCLREAERRTSPDADLYAVRITILKGMGAGRKEVDKAFEKGLKLDPTYHPLYQSMAHYLMPRWHGEPGDMERFAESLSKRADPELAAEMYMRIALSMLQYERFAYFERMSFDYPRILEGWAAFSKKYTASVEIQNQMAYLACLQRDRRTAAALMSPMSEQLWLIDVWGNKDTARAWARWANDYQNNYDESAERIIPADRLPPRAIEYTANGRQLLTCGMRFNDPFLLWDVKTLGFPRRLPNMGEPLNTCFVSADRKLIVAGGGSSDEGYPRLMVTSVSDPGFLSASVAPTAPIRGIAISQQSDLIAAVQEDAVLTIWKTRGLEKELHRLALFEPGRDDALIARYRESPGEMQCRGLAFSSDANRVFAVLGDGELRVWDLREKRLVSRWCEEHRISPKIRAFASARDASCFAIGFASDKGPTEATQILDGRSLETIVKLDHRVHMVHSLAFDDSAKVVAIGGENQVELCDAKSGDSLRQFSFGSKSATCLAFSPDGKALAAGISDGTVHIWDVTASLSSNP